tara:strand:- start:5025 stop:5666 length:642 start_codon:yes stop_codon:yes gene_type:complete
MRKRLYHFYNILASYPVIALLLAGFVGLFYVARQYRPVELHRQAMYLQQIELKQELKALQKELTGIEQTDLRRRYMLFNDAFLKPADAQAEALKSRFAQAFEVHGWTLQTAAVVELETTTEQGTESDPTETQIKGIMLDLNASATNSPQTDVEPFLPLYSVTQCLNYLWSRPPFKEYQQIKLIRADDGYALEASLFLPLRDLGGTDELSSNRP